MNPVTPCVQQSPATAEFLTDTRQFTLMSYFEAENYIPGIDRTRSDGLYARSATPLLYDIAAIHAKYGADTTTHATDAVYGFHSTAGRGALDFTLNKNPVVAIWDGGGIDTQDCSGFADNQYIDLRQGKYSDVGALTSNVVIAYNCDIENSVGGKGNDKLQGRAFGNTMDGSGGADTLVGADGNDNLLGGAAMTGPMAATAMIP